MPRKLPDDIEKTTIYLHKGDYDRLKEIYPELKAALVIRTLVHRHVEMYAKAERVSDLAQIKVPPLITHTD